MNGYIWIYQEDRNQKNEDLGTNVSISLKMREKMATIRNAIVALEKSQLPIVKDTITKVIEAQGRLNMNAKSMIVNYEKVTAEARAFIEKDVNSNMPRNTSY
jgi:hypothetical protein